MHEHDQHSMEDRIRLKAYEIWLLEGKPDGRDEHHWSMARELIAVDEVQHATVLLQPSDADASAVQPKQDKATGNGSAVRASKAGAAAQSVKSAVAKDAAKTGVSKTGVSKTGVSKTGAAKTADKTMAAAGAANANRPR